MSERWLPVLAAVVGVLGGMGGAFVGGHVANEGQQRRFEEEQKLRIENLRRETYVNYVRDLENIFFIGNTREKVRAAEAAVLLVSSPSIADVTRDVRLLAEGEDEDSYTDARDAFVKLAQQEIETGG
jgi:hypothetical protein